MRQNRVVLCVYVHLLHLPRPRDVNPQVWNSFPFNGPELTPVNSSQDICCDSRKHPHRDCVHDDHPFSVRTWDVYTNFDSDGGR